MASGSSTTGNILGAIGAVVGFITGGPIGAAQGYSIGSSIGNAIDPPKGPTVSGPRLADKSVQTSTYGTQIPRFYGTIAGSGNITWLEKNQLKETVRKKKQGGKGGGGGTTVKTYSYSATFFLSLGEGPIAGVRRIWCGDKLIYNAGSGDVETVIASNAASREFRVYRGTDDQMPDPRYQADVGIENASAFRGEAYIAFYDFQLADYANTLQAAQFKVEIVSDGSLSTPNLSKTVNYLGSLCYSDSDGFQTFEVLPGEVNGGITGTYSARVRFRDYSLSGALIRTRTLSQGISVQGTTSLVFYEGAAVVGIRDGIFAFRRSSPQAIAFPGVISAEVPVTLDQISSTAQTYAAGYYWISGSAGAYRVQGGYVSSYTLPGASADSQSFAIQQDSVTGRCYARWKKVATGKPWIGEFDPETMTVLWEYPLEYGSGADSLFYVHDDRICVKNQGLVKVYQVSGHTLSLLGSVAEFGTSARVNKFADGFALIGGNVYQVSDRQFISQVQLKDIISREVVRSGLIDVSDIDADALSSSVRGYRVTGGTIRNAVEPLQAAYPFDVIQSGYKVKFIPRGQTSSATIAGGDLGAAIGGNYSELISDAREMDSQLPVKTSIKYLDPDREYAIAEQYAERSNTGAVNRVDRELPIVLTANEAAGIAEVLNFLPWLERTEYSFKIPPAFLFVEPGDIVTVSVDNAIYELRLTDINYGPEGVLDCKGKPNSAAVYSSNAQGSEGVPPVGTIPVVGSTLLIPMDIPVIDETLQNDPGYSVAAAGYSTGWPGGVMYRSVDNGQTWSDLQAFSGMATIGYARNSLLQNDGNLIQNGGSLTVDILSGELESVTESQMLNGSNYCAYGADGRWEIIRFRDADLNADGSYTISGFIRGDKGTERLTGLHADGDAIILLTDPDNVFVGIPTAAIGAPTTYRGATAGNAIDSASDILLTYEAVNLKPLSAVHASGARDVSGNLSIKWIRRTRIGGEWRSNVDASIGEDSESYEIDVMDGATVKRTIASAAQSAIYSTADQTTDFGAPQHSVTVRIYQMSATVGRGYPLEVTL